MVGTPEIDHHEEKTHDDRGDREQLAEDHEVVQFLVAVDVDRNHHHDGRRRHPDEEGEIGNVDSPGDLVAHARDDQAVDQLLAVGVQADQAHQAQSASPGIVAPIAHEGDAGATPQEPEIVSGRRDHTSK